MTSLAHASRYTLGSGSQKSALTLVFCAVAMLVTPLAQGQTFSVLHNFTGRNDGSNPTWVAIDGHGNLYGTALGGGVYGAGTVFKLSHGQSEWILTPLHSFGSGNAIPDGVGPVGVVIGPDGRLYGVTVAGGGGGAGTVFSLAPPLTTCASTLCPWTETVLATFSIGSGGPAYPQTGDLAFDRAGNLYGTSFYGGYGGGDCAEDGCGTVYELSPSNGGWILDTIYLFSGSINSPASGVILDSSGNLYGTASGGGTGGGGTVYELTNNPGWSLTTLYNFLGGNDGAFPSSGLLFDGSGVLYGTTAGGGAGHGGTAFRLSPSDGNWTYDLIYSLSGNGHGPQASLIMDATGNLYGTTSSEGAYGRGNVFRLTPSSGSWVYTSLHDFTGLSDGKDPRNLVLDATGNLYGTTTYGGTVNADYCPFGCGVVWEIAP
jgi:uncharacterized repeat protein (TIGR03803 family)